MEAAREISKIETLDFTMNSCQNQQYQRSNMQRSAIMDRLRQEGCRITRQRKIILDIILKEECTCCKEIYFMASKERSEYRNGYNIQINQSSGGDRCTET